MIVDLFAGAGGWDIAARMVGLPDPLGNAIPVLLAAHVLRSVAL